MFWCPFLGTDENLVNPTKMRQILDVDCSTITYNIIINLPQSGPALQGCTVNVP